MGNGRSAHRGEQGVVLVEVDPNLEGGGKAAGSGVGGGPCGGGPEVAAHSGHSSDGGGGGGGGLQGGDLQVVSVGNLVPLDGIYSGHPGALRPDVGSLGGLNGGASDTIRGLRCSDEGAVADGAVAPGPPDADVIILVSQVSLRRRDGGGGGVPVKTSDCS